MAIEDIGHQLRDAKELLGEAGYAVDPTRYEVTLGTLGSSAVLESMRSYGAEIRGRYSVEIPVEPAKKAADLLRVTSAGTSSPVLRRGAGYGQTVYAAAERTHGIHPVIQEKARVYTEALQVAELALAELQRALGVGVQAAQEGEAARQLALEETERYLRMIGQ